MALDVTERRKKKTKTTTTHKTGFLIFRIVAGRNIEIYFVLVGQFSNLHYPSNIWFSLVKFGIEKIIGVYSISNSNYEGHLESKKLLLIQSAHLFCCKPIIGFWCTWKLPHAVVRRNLSRGKCRDSSGHGRANWESPADCEVRGVILFLQADEILGSLAEEASSCVELFCCTTIYVLILPGRHKPCCVSDSIGTSSSILRNVRTWRRRTFSCFQKWSTLLVNAS